MKNWLGLLKVILIVSIPFSLILLNLHLLLTRYFVQLNYTILGYEDKEEKLALATKTIEYIRGIIDENQLDKSVFTEKEINHLSDVRNLVFNALRIHLIATVLTVVSTLILKNEKVSIHKIKQCFYIGLFLTIVITLIVGMVTILDFNIAFIKFHQIFFTGGSWLFLPSDTLIKLFPIEFWINSAKILLVLTVTEVLLALFSLYKAESLKAKFNKLISQLIIR